MFNISQKIVQTSRANSLAIWEEGGGRTSTGFSIIVAGDAGEKISPIYVRVNGNLANQQHALFLLKEGIYVVVCNRRNDDYEVEVFRCGNDLTLNKVEIAPFYLETAIEAAKAKTRHYHCRIPHYVLPRRKRCQEDGSAVSKRRKRHVSSATDEEVVVINSGPPFMRGLV